MKLLSVALARSLWFMDVGELNPGGKDIYTHLLPPLLKDYRFKTWPKAGDDLSHGMKLTGGEFVKTDGTVIAVNLAVYSDGIAADSFSSTQDSDEFLQTVLTDLPALGFVYGPDIVRRKSYLSQVNVKCSKPLHALNPGLAEFAERVSIAAGVTFDLAAIELWPDQSRAFTPPNFSFQRRIGEPPDTDRYWSQAAVPTVKHLELLQALEEILS